MRKLVCRCPETQRPVDLQLYTDYVTLARIWSNSLRFQARTAARNMRQMWEQRGLRTL